MTTVYLIPAPLDPDVTQVLPAYVMEAIKECKVFFVENERTTRRYFKKCWKEMVIDEYGWHTIGEPGVDKAFLEALNNHRTIGIVSEAGCPGVADPGQELTALAHRHGATVKPLVGPSSILLALMASGGNGQQFHFYGYLPIEEKAREKMIRQIESAAKKENTTQLFIETPYRNNQLLAALLQQLQPSTLLCLAVALTGPAEWVRTQTVAEWKQQLPDLHKRPVIFLVLPDR
ncbi:MAG: SAM-dependent methyltransferase [Sphingomonadales bacterium]